MATTDARTLANDLATRDDAALARLFAARRVSPSASWADAFDAAEQLLDAASIARALTTLTAHEITALEAAVGTVPVPAGPERERLQQLALIDGGGAVWDAVADALAQTPRVVPPATTDRPPADADADTDAAAAERAFAAVSALADVLHEALAAPLSRIGAGSLGAADRRRLIEAGAVPDAAAADEIVDIAERADLLSADGRSLLVTPGGVEWLRTGTLSRWSEVATRLLGALPSGVRRRAGGWMPQWEWTGAYPYDPSWPAQADALAALLLRWAITGPAGAPTAWSAPSSTGGDLDLDALSALLPPEVDKVFLQNDLTAIAPGSLAPHLDVRLRSMARRESRAQASSYRFTAETLADALTAGESAESLRGFLTDISLTGLPQPLAYEIDRSASRHGALRVGPDWQARTRVTSDDTALLRTIAVDQALRPLGLVPDGEALITRSSPDTAFWMIADARYPVIAVDADGERRTLDRHRLGTPPDPAPDPVDVYADLLARLRAAQSGDADAAWLGRELEQAVRARATLVVAVRLPDGSEREFTIEATGLGGGRLRGLDRNVDVERTLPVSSITRVTPA